MTVGLSETKNASIMVMSGTKDAYDLIKRLSQLNKYTILATTTTNYGAKIAKDSGADEVIEGGLNQEEIEQLLRNNNILVVIDATHPFASNATKNAIKATNKEKIRYIRFERPELEKIENKHVYSAKSFEKVVEIVLNLLESSSGYNKIMYLAGVSNLEYLLKKIDKNQVYVRVLPSIDSIKRCLDIGLKPENIIAMQGTFSKEFNQALMKEYEVSIIITKESGLTGGTPSKISAALDLGLDVVIVERPEITELAKEKVFKDINPLIDYLINKMD